MAHPVPLPFPCPVKLGSIKGDSLEAELHDYVREGNYVKVKKLLKKGVSVDAVNSMGQTCLFTAALLGLSKIVDVLLDFGSDANHRCFDGSTPVHAAAFSGNQWILSKLLDEGGDLRAHDKDGRTPQHWALSARKECSAQMLEFIQQCTLHMQAAIQNFPSDLLRKVGSSKALVSSPSRFGGLVQGNIDSALGRLLKGEASVAKNIYSFGFGKFYLAGNGHLGYLASLPIIGEKDVVQADDEPAFSYHVGPFMIMTNLMWGGSRVTVKELGLQPLQHSWKLRLADLLLAEQEHSSKLRHPHLLQLMSVCLSSDLEKTRLVYERVHFGSLYSILHERRTEFPVLQTETILHVLLQIIDALRFLHSRGFIHRSLSSYAIQMVSSGEAKLCNLEYMIESKDSGEHSDLTRIPVPVQLYRWCSPEVILERAATVKSDVYSFCAVLQEALTESPPWKGFEDSDIKQLIISGDQLEADVSLPMLYYDVVRSGLEPKQRNRSMKLQDIQYILKNDLKDLVKSQSGRAGDMPKARRPAVFADVNICWTSAFSCQERTVEFQEKEAAKAGGSPAPRDPVFREETRALVVQEASTSVQPVAQHRSPDVASEVQTTPSESDVDESLCSFEINEIFATYPEIHTDFLGGGSGLDQTLKAAKRQQKEEDKSPLGVLTVSSGASCEDEEDSDSSELGTEFTAEEEEEEEEESSEASDLAQGRGDAGRRGKSPSPNEQHISRCVLNIKIIQSMLQQAADSLCRTEENLDRLKAIGKQKKLLQEIRTSQLCKQSFQERHCNRSDDASQNTNHPFSGVNTFLPKAVGPPSSDYIPPPMTCQAQGALGEDDFQAVPKAARGTQAVQNEKRKSNIDNNQRDFGCSMRRSLDDEMNLNHECVLNHGLLDSFQHLLPRGSARCPKKLNLQCQRGADSHPAARSEEGRWSYSKPRSEFYSQKISEERRMMQSDWRTEVKRMARRVASGQLELSCPCPASEGTSESEAESAKEPFQHVTARAPKSQAQQRCRWQPGDDVEPWDPGSEDRTGSEESDLESALRSSGGRRCQSPSQDEQAESGIAIHQNSVLPQQAENLSRGHSRELHCSLSSPPDVSEEFFTPDYFLPPEGSSELEVKITEKTLDLSWSCSHSQCGSESSSLCQCCTPSLSTWKTELPASKAGRNVDAAREATLWEPQEECQEKDVSVADIQDLSSIPCEQENFQRDGECKTPRLSHAPTSVSTPLGSEEKIPLAFEKYKHCHELASDFSLCGSQEASSTMFRTFTTACEGERSVEIPGAASRVCQLELKEPVIYQFTFLCLILFGLTQDGLPPVVPPLRNTRQAPALSEASQPSIDELPPPAQELLDEIELLKQQDSITPDLKEVGLQDCGVQINVPNQIRMESRESEKEFERNERQNQSSWTKESFTLAEDTERAHSTLDDILERMLHAVPGDEEVQEQ
ncbi:TEX14 kinase, partial [Neopipo cinnamomea]|nr:TEX14 kinase [Neopipo cinnamomea]